MKKLINLVVTNRKSLCFVLIMEAQEGVEIRMEGNLQQGPPRDPRQNSDGNSPMELLETMRNLIVEL
jgi:hypothetical protein